MKIPLLIIILITTTSTSIGQIQLLKNYHFEKGGYSIIGTRAESDPNGLADSLGEFYTNDINVLNSFKKEWIFKKPSPQYSCGYHFIVSVCKDGFPIESFDINLNCNVIATDKGYFYFDSRKLRIFKGKLEKPVVKREKFSSVQEARAARNKMLSQRNLIMTYEPSWTKYEGEFNFTYTCRKGTGDCLDQGKKIIKQLTQEI